MARTKNGPKAHALGAELREARTAAKLTQRNLAARLGRPSHSDIVKWEAGQSAPSVEDTATVLEILGITGAKRDELLELAREAGDPNWVAPGLDRHLAALSEYERVATRITSVQPQLLPGVLQTADYARSIMLSAGATQGEADQRVTYRMGRRDILTRPNPVEFCAIIGEAALRFPAVKRSVMVEQLRYLEKWSRNDNVTVQVLPLASGYTPALVGPFVLIEFQKALPVVVVEHYRSTTTLTDAGDVKAYMDAADTIRRQAMSPDLSADCIAVIADEMEQAA